MYRLARGCFDAIMLMLRQRHLMLPDMFMLPRAYAH